MDFPIDLICPWVDGGDPKWRAKKNAALIAAGEKPADNDVSIHRFFDNDELKYSLRSVEKFAPWIRKIFIITDEQVPEWMNTDNPKIQIVDHAEILPPEARPCFNSSTLMLNIHKAPGLSKHFLIANDDLFFGRATKPSYFFTKDGTPKLMLSRRSEQSLARCDQSYSKVLTNAKKIVRKICGESHDYDWTPSHNFIPMRKDIIKKTLAEPEIFDVYKESLMLRFRSPNGLNAGIFSEYAMAKGLVRARIYGNFKKLLLKLCGKRFPVYDDDARRVLRMWIKPNLFCINDSGLCPEADRRNREILALMFPEKSEFEK